MNTWEVIALVVAVIAIVAAGISIGSWGFTLGSIAMSTLAFVATVFLVVMLLIPNTITVGSEEVSGAEERIAALEQTIADLKQGGGNTALGQVTQATQTPADSVVEEDAELITTGASPRHLYGWGTGVGIADAHDWQVPSDHVLIVWGVEVDGTSFAAKVYTSDPGLIAVKDGYGFVVHEEFANDALCQALNGAGQIDIVQYAPGMTECPGFEGLAAA